MAPPALLVAVAVGLGTIDMPVPSVEEWAWLNWKFPRPVHAGETLYARWTLTQKRPPIGGAATAIVVWRVDLHTSDGALCAEGEVGAKVRRQVASQGQDHQPATEAASAATPRRRRRRRPASTTGTAAALANGLLPEAPAIAAPPASVAKPERAAGAPRRRRRRRPSGAAAGREGEAAGTVAPASEPAPPPDHSPAAATAERGGLSGVIRRLRRT